MSARRLSQNIGYVSDRAGDLNLIIIVKDDCDLGAIEFMEDEMRVNRDLLSVRY